MSAIRALFDQIDAEIEAREARIERRLVLWHHLREQALQVQNEASAHQKWKWEMAELGVMPGELNWEPDWNGHEEAAAWRRRASLYDQSWVLAARLHADGVRDPTDGCECRSCYAWRADHAAAYAREDWEYRPAPRREEESASEMRLEALVVATRAAANRVAKQAERRWHLR